MVIVGPSGSGKTTLLNCLVGVHDLVQGKISLKDRELKPASIEWIRGEVGYIGQEPFLGASTAREALLLPFQYHKNHGKQPSQAEILETLEKLHLSEAILDQRSSDISGGEKQRLAIARALLLKKEIFLLDEITSALDPESKEAVIELFSQDSYTLLSVSHDPKWIEVCHRELSIKNGKIISDTKRGEH